MRRFSVLTLAGGSVLAMAAGAVPALAQGPRDPSFEQSGPAYQGGATPIWTPTSTNFGAPFCNSDCLGPGQSGRARTGSWWVWFGGTSGYEHATISQQVDIPAGGTQLQFYLWAYTDRASPTDTLKVYIDSTLAFTINNLQILPYLAGYAPVVADLSSFPGGHTLTLVAETLADVGVTNFFVDDVSLLGATCYPNCDGSTAAPVLNVADFTCFLQRFAQGCGSPGACYPNCDGSTGAPFLNVADFTCFLQKFATGCSAP